MGVKGHWGRRRIEGKCDGRWGAEWVGEMDYEE